MTDNVASIPRPQPPTGAGDPADPGDEQIPPELAEACRRLIADLRAQREPGPRTLAPVMAHLRDAVCRLFPDVDGDDVVQTVMARVLARPEPLVAADRPWAYLLTSTRNAAIDALRRRGRRHEVDLEAVAEQPSGEDDVAALLERDATRRAVVAALREHVVAGDAAMVQIITAWLDTADELGRAPSTRAVAQRAGVSHTSVATALRRFRSTLERHL